MSSFMSSVLSKAGKSGFSSPPNTYEQSFGNVQDNDGKDLFRLMSKANKYSGASSGRKQKKAGNYAYMAGKLMNDNGIQDPKYAEYHEAYNQGTNHGCSPTMVDDFRSGRMTQQRRQRREGKGRYASRPQNHNEGKGRHGKKEEGGGMFDFFDSDTSSSSSSDSN